MDLRNKIIMAHIKNIVWFIAMWCIIFFSILLLTIIGMSIHRGDQITEPMGPAHNWVAPNDAVMDSVDMNCGE